MHQRTAGGYTTVTVNPLLRREDDRQRMNRHHDSVVTARPKLDTWNDTFAEVHELHRHNRSVNRFEDARQAQIKRDNEILVGKMARTVLRPATESPLTGCAPVYGASQHKAPAHHTTLNYLNRKHERDRILNSNMSFAKRIIEQKPIINSNKWAAHSREHDRLLSSLSRFEPVDQRQTLARARARHSTGNGRSRAQLAQQQQQHSDSLAHSPSRLTHMRGGAATGSSGALTRTYGGTTPLRAAGSSSLLVPLRQQGELSPAASQRTLAMQPSEADLGASGVPMPRQGPPASLSASSSQAMLAPSDSAARLAAPAQ